MQASIANALAQQLAVKAQSKLSKQRAHFARQELQQAKKAGMEVNRQIQAEEDRLYEESEEMESLARQGQRQARQEQQRGVAQRNQLSRQADEDRDKRIRKINRMLGC